MAGNVGEEQHVDAPSKRKYGVPWFIAEVEAAVFQASPEQTFGTADPPSCPQWEPLRQQIGMVRYAILEILEVAFLAHYPWAHMHAP